MSYPICSSGGVNTQHPNPDHNIWNNNGTYWCHYTVHGPNNTARRVRVSLETKDREEARKRRDDLLKNTINLSSKVPWPTARRGQAMPDVGSDVCESCASPRAALQRYFAHLAY